MVNGVVTLNEVIDLAKCIRKGCRIFKVDFEKAYDSVSWSFLDYILIMFGLRISGDLGSKFMYLLAIWWSCWLTTPQPRRLKSIGASNKETS